MGKNEEWESLLEGEGLEGWTETWFTGAWSRAGDSLVGHLTVDKNSLIWKGDSTWSDFEVSVTGTLIEGSNLQVLFRISDGGGSFYAFDWGNVGRVALSRFSDDSERVILSFVDYPIEMGQEYHIAVAARDQTIKTYIEGNLVHELTDSAYTSGGVGFNMWHRAKVNFTDPQIRHSC